MFVEFIGFVMLILFNIGTVPQLIKTYRTKKVDDLSVDSYRVYHWAFASAIVYTVASSSGIMLIISYIISFVLNGLMLAMIKMYRKV